MAKDGFSFGFIFIFFTFVKRTEGKKWLKMLGGADVVGVEAAEIRFHEEKRIAYEDGPLF